MSSCFAAVVIVLICFLYFGQVSTAPPQLLGARKSGFKDTSVPDAHSSSTKRDALHSYDKRIRPVKNWTESMKIQITLTMYQLVEVDEAREQVAVNVWISHAWRDEYLVWDPAERGGITHIVLPWESVWLSDIVLYNGLDMNYAGSEKRINVEARIDPSMPSKAYMRFAFPAIYRFSCRMDVTYFPFDTQNCTMIFGSWIYDATLIHVVPMPNYAKMDNFITHQEWEVLSVEAYAHVLEYSCCEKPYSNVQYHVVMRRRSMWFLITYIVPTVAVCFVSIWGTFVPGTTTGDRNEKVNLGIATILSLSVLMLMVGEKMPTSGTGLPLIATFFLIDIILVAVATTFSVAVILIQRRPLRRTAPALSPGVRNIFFKTLAPMVLVFVPYDLRPKTKPKSGNHSWNLGLRGMIQRRRSYQRVPEVSIQAILSNEKQSRVEQKRQPLVELHPLPVMMNSNNQPASTAVDHMINNIDRLQNNYSLKINHRSNVNDVNDTMRSNHRDDVSGKIAHQNSGGDLTNQDEPQITDYEVLADVVERLLLVIFIGALLCHVIYTISHVN